VRRGGAIAGRIERRRRGRHRHPQCARGGQP
jgi:hypothetical protein